MLTQGLIKLADNAGKKRSGSGSAKAKKTERIETISSMNDNSDETPVNLKVGNVRFSKNIAPVKKLSGRMLFARAHSSEEKVTNRSVSLVKKKISSALGFAISR